MRFRESEQKTTALTPHKSREKSTLDHQKTFIMSNILDLLNSDLGKNLIQGVASKTGQSPDKTSNLLSQAMPLILGAMQRNAANPQGAQSLNKALENPKHAQGSVMDMLGSPQTSSDNDALLKDGSGILSHVLGGKQPQVEQALSKTSGLDAGTVSDILKMAAPVIMGLLSKEKQSAQVDANNIGDLLGSLLGQSGGGKSQSFINSILDANNDGNVMDDIAGMVMGNSSQKKGGLGGLLGGLFGKK